MPDEHHKGAGLRKRLSLPRDKSLQSTENVHVRTSNYILSNTYVRADAESLKLKHKFFLEGSVKTNKAVYFKNEIRAL